MDPKQIPNKETRGLLHNNIKDSIGISVASYLSCHEMSEWVS